MSEKLAQSESIPVAYEYQHEETGVIGYVDPWQIENGFFKNNSRLQLIGPLYRHPPPESALQARIDALEEKVKGKCKYYRESPNEQYTPSCTGTSWSVHPEDIEGDFCQFCGGKIKLKEYTAVPYHLLEAEK